jgi:hypothetical protein
MIYRKLSPWAYRTMSDTRFFAHSGHQSDLSDWQLLSVHLQGVARSASMMMQAANAGELQRNSAYLAGLLHDLGKYHDIGNGFLVQKIANLKCEIDGCDHLAITTLSNRMRHRKPFPTKQTVAVLQFIACVGLVECRPTCASLCKAECFAKKNTRFRSISGFVHQYSEWV